MLYHSFHRIITTNPRGLVLVILFPFYKWGNGGTGWLSNLPGLHSWKMVELALQLGQSGSWAFALTYSAYCPTRSWKRCQTIWGWRPKAKLVQAQKVHVTSLTLNKKILENIKCPPMPGQLTVFWAFLHQCAWVCVSACVCVCMGGKKLEYPFFFILVSWPTSSCLSNETVCCFVLFLAVSIHGLSIHMGAMYL